MTGSSAPPLKTLMAFEAAGRLGSFSLAADHLAITQSAVSQQIKKLEDFVGQALFLRKGSGIRLTAAGELLYESVRKTLEQLQAGFDRIEPYKNQDSVLLVCPADFAQGWLNPRLGEIRRLRPAVEVWLITGREVLEIDRIDVDLIISRRSIHTADVECVPLLEDASIAVCGREAWARLSRLSFPGVLERSPLLFLESEPDWGGLLRDARLRERKLLRAATVDNATVLLDLAARGLGIAYVSRSVAEAALWEGSVVALDSVPSLSRPRYWLMRSRLMPRTPVADFAFNWLREAASGRPGRARPTA